ncbi:helix-turn-helix domain-containing protein [Paenibacillus sp. CF384]|uniref:helix-turn-helix domain-containing protein n=1 Tax=Paenibacillus sp. CF384 TaxID=1884382 RepID=UPI000894D654|nr:helix-turn-helix domain-containing protein [Paenibacillus sp. CF384]SDX71227.1 ABC-type Fe3+-hydroxamate transport system, substrate-binding protein [Paenibacillus sp. CF384]
MDGRDKKVEHNDVYASLEGLLCKLRDITHRKQHRNEWELKLQFIEKHMMLVMASGKGRLHIDGYSLELRQGSVYVLKPGQLIQATVHSLDERGFYELGFDVFSDELASSDSLQRVTRNSPFPVQGEVNVSSPVSLHIACRTIDEYMKSGEPLKRFRSQILFQELIETILGEALLVQEIGLEAALEYAKGYIEQHYRQELTIEHLAKLVGISSRHFMRLFKKRYGTGAIDYLTLYRIKQAQQLIRAGGQDRLRDIARHVGYQDDIYFRRKFRQVTGIPPAAFMKNSRKKIIAYHNANIGQLIALQITPCAAPAEHPWTDYYRRKYETDAVVPLSSIEWEKKEEIGHAAPDFIIGVDIHASIEEQNEMKAIAPAYFVPWMENDWRMHLRLIAQFLDMSAAAEVWLDNYDRRARFVREAVRDTVKEDRLLILRITGEHCTVLAERSLATVFYDDLQLMPAHGVDRMKPDEQVNPSQLAAFAADRILLVVDEDSLSQSTWKTIANSEDWNRLEAVVGNRVAFIPAYPWIEYTAFTHEFVLEEALNIWRNRA